MVYLPTGFAKSVLLPRKRTFALCREALGRGESLALFPEGVSHADARLKPLKTGAARIALSALAAPEGAARGLRIVPVGIAYEARATFRSRAFVQIGPPIDPSAHLDAYRTDEHAAVNALTAQLARALASVLPQADTREVLDGVAAVAGWVSEAPAGGLRDDYAERVRRGREMLDAFATLRERDRGPARYLRARDEHGAAPAGARRVGFITGTSDTYCAGCDRLRVSSDGVLRPCLARPEGVALGSALRAGDAAQGAARVGEALAQAWAQKPPDDFRGCTEADAARVSMRATGG